jgi:double-stranded uracil-DNA glycosylase
MSHVHAFEPITTQSATILLLGSAPGKVSLAAGEYYAHPRNAFWRIMADLLGFPHITPYFERIKHLQARKIALWDVVQTCTRTSSLDSDIDDDSVVPNNIQAFLRNHPHIRLICFNGAKSHELYRLHIQPRLASDTAHIQYLRLPSTSPAHASMPYAHKLQAWSSGLTH